MTGNAYGKPPPMLQPRGDAARTFFEEEIFFFMPCKVALLPFKSFLLNGTGFTF